MYPIIKYLIAYYVRIVLIQSRIFDITASQVKNRSLETERNLTFVMHSYQFVVGRYCIMFIGP